MPSWCAAGPAISSAPPRQPLYRTTTEYVLVVVVTCPTPSLAVTVNVNVPGLDERTTNGPGYQTSQRIRKRVEEIFGWMKTVGGLRRTRYRGTERA